MKHSEILPIENIFRLIKKLMIFGCFCFVSKSFAQKNVTHQNLLWYGYYNTLVINEKYSILSEIQERHFIDPSAQHQLIFRSNLQRKLDENWNVSGGLTYFLQSPNDPNSESDLVVPEIRPDIGFGYQQKLKKITINHRYKAEARFFHDTENDELTGGFRFSNLRFRYQLGIDIPLVKDHKTNKNKLVAKIKDEIMVNVGRKIVKNTFDQNRIYGALNYSFHPSFSIELGYMNWYQQRSSGVDFYNRNIFRLSLFHQISLKQNKNNEK